MPESGKQNAREREAIIKARRQASASRDTDAPIPKPTTDLGFHGIRHMRRHDSVSRPRRTDN